MSVPRQAQVLVVDDNQDAASSLVLLLELEEISTAAVPDAWSALELIEQVRPQLLLIDIGLPGMNGIELASRLRHIPATRDATLIALTGHEESADQVQAAGIFDQYWTKPFDPKKLLREIKAVLERAPSAD